MKACNRSAVRVSAWCLAALVAACFATAAQAQEAPASAPAAATEPATRPASAPATQPAPAPLTADELPAPQSVKAMDEPSDDGSAIIVQWARPAKEVKGVRYIVEAAQSEADFAIDKVEVVDLDPTRKKSRGSAAHEIFGYSKTNENIYFTEIGPADFGSLVENDKHEYKFADPLELPIEALRYFRGSNVLSPAEFDRAQAALAVLAKAKAKPKPTPTTSPSTQATQTASTKPGPTAVTAPAYVPTLAEQADIRWFHRLCGYLDSVNDCAGAAGDLITDAESKRARAALRVAMDKPEWDFTADDRAEQEWLGRLQTYLGSTAQFKGLAGLKIIDKDQLERAQAALKIEFAKSSQFTDKEKAELTWLKSLRSYPGALGLLNANLNIEDVATLLLGAYPGALEELEKSITPKGLSAKDWAAIRSKLHPYPDPMKMLKSWSAKKGTLSKAEWERAKAALKISLAKPEAQRSDEEQTEVKWVKRLLGVLGKQAQAEKEKKDREKAAQTYLFRLAAVQGLDRTYVCQKDGKPVVCSASATPDLFKWYKLNNLIFSLVFCGIVFAFIQVAKRRPGMFIRKIGGLDAVDEAIGRSTEMAKPVFFVHGLGDMSDLATIASVNILGRVAQRAAEHDSQVRVMNSDPIVMAVSQEVVQQSCTQAGRPDAYSPDNVSLVATDQFSYVAAVSGRMVREQPGAIFLLGSFAAESLLLAENGASTGAIQVAGTDAYTQLPFFITTCDYTLIGEELYAASAYLSREPRLLGSLRGQDVGKAFLMLVIVVVPVILTVAVWQKWDFGWLLGFFSGGKG